MFPPCCRAFGAAEPVSADDSDVDLRHRAVVREGDERIFGRLPVHLELDPFGSESVGIADAYRQIAPGGRAGAVIRSLFRRAKIDLRDWIA